MSNKVVAMAAASAGAKLEATLIERREPRAHDILIDIAYAGICHSDIHQVREEWGAAIFPMVPGHEIAGTVSAIGPAVSRFGPGTGWASGASSTPAASAPTARRARSSTA